MLFLGKFVANRKRMNKDHTAGGIIELCNFPPSLGSFDLFGAAIAFVKLIFRNENSIKFPRLIFSWAEDGIFSKRFSAIHSPIPSYPHIVLFYLAELNGNFGDPEEVTLREDFSRKSILWLLRCWFNFLFENCRFPLLI